MLRVQRVCILVWNIGGHERRGWLFASDLGFSMQVELLEDRWPLSSLFAL